MTSFVLDDVHYFIIIGKQIIDAPSYALWINYKSPMLKKFYCVTWHCTDLIVVTKKSLLLCCQILIAILKVVIFGICSPNFYFLSFPQHKMKRLFWTGKALRGIIAYYVCLVDYNYGIETCWYWEKKKQNKPSISFQLMATSTRGIFNCWAM